MVQSCLSRVWEVKALDSCTAEAVLRLSRAARSLPHGVRYIAHKMGHDSSDEDLEQPLPRARAAVAHQLEHIADSFGGESLPTSGIGGARGSQPSSRPGSRPGSRASSPAARCGLCCYLILIRWNIPVVSSDDRILACAPPFGSLEGACFIPSLYNLISISGVSTSALPAPELCANCRCTEAVA